MHDLPEKLRSAEFWIWLLFLKIIWRQSRTIAYLRELCRREQERSFSRCSDIVKALTEIFLREPAPSLKDLVKGIEATFKTPKSKGSFEPPHGD